MSKKTIRVSDATFRAIAAQHGFVVTESQVEQPASPFKVGDTVRIVGPMFTGQIGELKIIDPENIDSCDFFGVYLDSAEKVVPFAADELERICSPAEIQTHLTRFFQDVSLYLLKEALYERLPGVEIKINIMAVEEEQLPF